MLTPQLPRDPAEIIEVSAKDLTATFDDPKVVVAMGGWWETYDGVCHVCLAGAALRRIIRDAELIESREVREFTCEDAAHPMQLFEAGVLHFNDVYRLSFLNHIRVGDLPNALSALANHSSYPREEQAAVHNKANEVAELWARTCYFYQPPVLKLGLSEHGRRLLNAPRWSNDPEYRQQFMDYLQLLVFSWRRVSETERADMTQYFIRKEGVRTDGITTAL